MDFVHFSQISSYLLCGRKHKYAYQDRLEPLGWNPRMLLGTFGHALLADYATRNPPGHLSEALKKVYDQGLSQQELLEVESILQTAKDVVEKVCSAIFNRFEPVEVEKSRTVKVHGVEVGGTPDLVAKDREDGSLWILDYKFRKAFQPPESEDLNLQMMFYQGLLSQNGIEVLGTRQVQIRSSAPKIPRINKDGSMSRADIISDWSTYKAALLLAGLNPSDYSEMEAKLSNHQFLDFDSCRAFRSKKEVDAAWEQEIAPAVWEISHHRSNRRCFNFDTCKRCGYQELCIEDLKGGDTNFIKQAHFRNKDDKSMLLPILEEE